MKNYGLIVLAGLALLTGCANPRESAEYKQLQQRNDSLRSQVALKDQEVDDVAAAITEIENNLAAIEKDEMAINQLRREGQDQNQKDRVNMMIAGIDSYIEQNRQRIDKLEQQIKRSNRKSASLQKLVNDLRSSIARKEEEIATLRSTISGLETEVTDLRQTVVARERSLTQRDSTLQMRQRDIQERDEQIYTAYYVVGDRRELARNGVIDKTGGVLGIGKTAKVSGSIDRSRFTQINTRNTDEIVVGNTKKPRLISPHPDNSYYFSRVGDEVRIKITDSRAFWSLTRYAVVEKR